MSTHNTLAAAFVLAVFFNYAWELAQAPLYIGLESYSATVLWHCFVASLGDGIMVLIIVVTVSIALRQWDWFRRPGLAGYAVMATTGLGLAVLVEWVAVHILERWDYTEKMPTLFGIRIGFVPIAQMLILPPLIVRIVGRFGTKRM